MAATRLKGRRKKAAAASSSARTASSASKNKKAPPQPPPPEDVPSAFKPTGLSSEAFLKVTSWSPTILPQAVEITINDQIDVVLTMVGHLSGKYGKGNATFSKTISDEAHRIITGRQLSDDLDLEDGNELDGLINLTSQAIVMQVRDLGGKFLKLVIPAGKKRRSTFSAKGREIGDIGAIKKTKSQLVLTMKKLHRDSDKGAEGGRSPSSAGNKQLPTAEEKKYLAMLSPPTQAQVGCLKALPSWDVDSAVKIINIPDFYVRDDLTAGDSADAENPKKRSKRKTHIPSWKTCPDGSHKKSSSASSKTKATKRAGSFGSKAIPRSEPTESPPAQAKIPQEANAKLNLEEPLHELCVTECLKPLEGATRPEQQLELEMPPLFSPRPTRASCPATIFQAVRTPTLQDLLELKDDLFARDTAKPGTLMGQPKTTGELADGERKRSSTVGSTKRSSCPAVFMSPIAVSYAPKKRVKLAHLFSCPVPPDEMAPPPTIFRVTSSTVNLSDVVKGLSLEDSIVKNGTFSHPGMPFGSLKTPIRSQEGTVQVDSAAPSFTDWGSADENYTPTQLRQKDSGKSVGSIKSAASSDSRGSTIEDLKDISCYFGAKRPEQGL